jgi:3-hydroxyisobutyrate dehydrogenase-like beta-hydroxyacid dehydrogenase
LPDDESKVRTLRKERIMKIGFIGLGNMGIAMAGNLLKAGHEVIVYNRTADKAGTLVAKGAKLAPSIAAASDVDVVLTMLANDEAVEGVVLGPEGVLSSLRPGSMHISSSTISVPLSERMAREHAKLGQRYVAAPVFGRPAAAAAAELLIVAAGEHDAVVAAKPLLEVLGKKVFVAGEAPGTANLIKLSGNFLSASAIESIGEAFALTAKAGVDREQYLEILTTLFDASAYRIYAPLIASGRFEPAAFRAPLAQKDIRLLLAAAEKLSVPMPFASVLRDRFLTLIAHGGERLDWSAIGGLASQDARVANA